MSACFTSTYTMATGRQTLTLTAVVSTNSQERRGGVEWGGLRCTRITLTSPRSLFLPGGNVCFTYDKVPLSTDHRSVYTYIYHTASSQEAQSTVFIPAFFFLAPFHHVFEIRPSTEPTCKQGADRNSAAVASNVQDGMIQRSDGGDSAGAARFDSVCALSFPNPLFLLRVPPKKG